MVLRPEALAITRKLVRMQTIGPTPDLQNQKLGGRALQFMSYQAVPAILMCTEV